MPTSCNASPRALPADRTLRTGLLVLSAGFLATGLFQTIAPGAFVHDIGPYGTPSAHYVRDLATWSFALAAGLFIAAGRPAWRVPVLAVSAIQGILHVVNHLVDIDNADRPGFGIANTVALALLVGVTGWLLAIALRDGGAR